MTDLQHPVVPPAALQLIYQQARDEYPAECCGIIFGPRETDLADQVKPCRNMQDELHRAEPDTHTRDARTAYHLAAADLLELDRSLRGNRPAKIIYHSHVDVGAYFSETDQQAAQFDGDPAYPVEYLVVDVRSDGARGAAQFAWDADLARYVEVRRY